MRIWISGPHIGPVRSTLWSSGGRRGGGKVLAALFLPLAVVALAVQFARWQLDLAVAVLVLIAAAGHYAAKHGR